MKFVGVLMLFISFFSLSLLALDKSYTIKDLEILKDEKSYAEFFQHAEDVKPSERDKYWKDMVRTMGEGYAAEILENVNESSFMVLEDLLHFSELKEDEFFLHYRGKVGEKYFELCLTQDKTNCVKKIQTFWKKAPESPNVGFNLAKLWAKSLPSERLGAWILVEKALTLEVSHFYCQDQFIQGIIWDKLSNDLAELSSQEFKKKIAQQFHPQCWTVLKEVLHPGLRSTQKSIRELSYLILSSRSEITTEEEDYYWIINYLEMINPGKTLNLAWNRLEQLGQNSQRRDKVLAFFVGKTPLPDQLFQSTKSALIEHLAKNFPEYVQLYGKTCVNYLSGMSGHAQGNPTPSCHNLFSQKKATRWMGESLMSEYLQSKI